MKPKVVVVMPAYNASATLKKTVRDIPQGLADHIVLVDDSSKDGTVEIAKALGLNVVVHDQNRGYGANQKTCYDEALKLGADIVIMIHSDYQYDGSLAPLFVEIIKKGVCDIVIGSRVRTRQECLHSGMPLYKYLANRLLTLSENLVTGENLAEWHTGYRAYSRKVLETIPYHRNSNGFVFDTQFLFQATHFGFKIGDLPVPCRYMSDASSINLSHSILYGLGTFKTMCQYILHKLHLKGFNLFKPSENRPNG